MAFERITLNIIPDGEMPVFHCSQFETGRPIIIDLVSSDDDAFTIGEGVSVELHCRKVDDNIVTLEPDEVDGNTVTFVSTEQLTACIGDNLCELVLYSDTDPVQTLGTLNFMLHVECDPIAGGVESETAIYNLTEQIEDIISGEGYLKSDDVAPVALTGSYNDLTDKPTIPDMTNYYTKSETYSKTQVDDALALKANTADLATVATTGDYDDLINKPTIPAAQIQSDYAQADNTQVDYIKNKPDIAGMIASAIFDILPIGSASGSIASFETEIAERLQSLKCNFLCSGGNGTPSTPIPLVPLTELNVTNCGFNQWDEEWELGGISSITGLPEIDPTRIRSKNYMPCFPNTNYYGYIGATSVSLLIYWYNNSNEYISRVNVTNSVVTSPSNAQYFKIMTYDTLPQHYTTYNNDISINYPLTDTTYHAYNGQTITIDLDGTRYGGYVDANNGKLVVDCELLKATDDGSWRFDTSAGTYNYVYKNNLVTKNDLSKFKCNIMPVVNNNADIGITRSGGGFIQIFVNDLGVTNLTEWQQYINNNDVYILYPLTTPIEVDITPAYLNAHTDVNNVFHDGNGTTEVSYKDTIQHYIDERT